MKQIQFPQVPLDSNWTLPTRISKENQITKELKQLVQSKLNNGDIAKEGYISLLNTLTTQTNIIIPLKNLTAGMIDIFCL